MCSSIIRTRNATVALPGRHAVVVGGTSGIGEAIAVRLAQAKVNVTVVGRSRERGLAVVQELQRASGSDDVHHDFVPCDSSLLANVRDFATGYAGRGHALDFLVLTQGIATVQGFTPTAEGIDQKMSLHYYSRVAFADQLMPLLERGEDSRVLSVLSAGVHKPYEAYETDPDLSKSYSLGGAANAAGFYNDIAADSLSREHPRVTFLHAAPGFVKTAWGTEMPFAIRALVRVAQVFAKSPADCAENMCDGLFNPAWRGGYRLMSPSAAAASATRLHEAARASVWAHTRGVLDRVFGAAR